MPGPLLLPIFFAAIIAVVLFVALALSRGGGAEGSSSNIPPGGALPNLTVGELTDLASRLYQRRGFTVASKHVRADGAELVMEKNEPLTGQRIYVRCVPPPAGALVQSTEINAANDLGRGEQHSRVVIITSGSFSDEAKLAAHGTGVELVDGAMLARLAGPELSRWGGRKAAARLPGRSTVV